MYCSRKKFNILHVVSRLPVGGVENMISKVVRRYDTSRYHVSICCIKEGGAIADALKRDGFDVAILGKMQTKGFDIGAVVALCKLIRRKEIHVIRTHQYHANLYGRIAGVLAGVPVIIPSYHSAYVSPQKPKFHRRVINHVLSHLSSELVAVSEAIKQDMIHFDRVARSRIRVIHNGVDLWQFNQNRSKEACRMMFGLPVDSVIIGSVGRLVESKDHRTLIEAASKISGCCVVIASNGPMRRQLEDEAIRGNVHCIFTGRVDPEKVPYLLKSFDIFCFPSLYEGLPTALIEAMASGLPVVASDIPPHREVMRQAGILVPPGDVSGLSHALEQMATQRALREEIGRGCIERAAAFSIEKTVHDYQDLFEHFLRAKGLMECSTGSFW